MDLSIPLILDTDLVIRDRLQSIIKASYKNISWLDGEIKGKHCHAHY